MHVHRTALALLALATVTASHAATEFGARIPVELVRYFSGGGTAYRDLPDNFPIFVLPADILLMGSQGRAYEQKVLYRTTLSGADAQAALAGVLLAEGWQELPPPGAGRQTGFVVPAPAVNTNVPVTLCHDAFGNLEIRGVDGSENRVYVRRFNLAGGADRPTCEVQNQRRENPRQRIAGRESDSTILQYLPALRIGENPGPLDMAVVSIRGIQRSGFSTERSFRGVAGSLAEIGAQYADQLREQGWQLDAEWTGTATAGSNWTRSPEPELRLYLTVVLIKVADEDFDLKLTIASLE